MSRHTSRSIARGATATSCCDVVLEISRAEREQWQTIVDELEIDFASARQRYEADLAPLLPSAGRTKAADTVRLPYREHVLSTGLRIYIGRDGADNDRTTFEFARPV